MKTNLITIRPFQQNDLSELYKQFSNKDVRGNYYPDAMIPESLFYAEFAKNGFWTDESKRIAVTDKNDCLLGMLHLFKVSSYNDMQELSYILLDKSQSNKGIITQALTLAVDYVFRTSRLVRLQLTIPEGNIASIRVAEKAGFMYEGTMRQAIFLNGQDKNLLLYSILKEEWMQNSV